MLKIGYADLSNKFFKNPYNILKTKNQYKNNTISLLSHIFTFLSLAFRVFEKGLNQMSDARSSEPLQGSSELCFSPLRGSNIRSFYKAPAN